MQVCTDCDSLSTTWLTCAQSVKGRDATSRSTSRTVEAVSFDQVLAVGEGESLRVGAPYVAGVTVKGTVIGHGRGDKVLVFKMRRRKGYRRTQGHRQSYTEVRIDDIVG